MTYGQKYIAELGVAGAIFRINHLRAKLDKYYQTRVIDINPENLASESDNLARAIMEVEPKYDWVTNTILV